LLSQHLAKILRHLSGEPQIPLKEAFPMRAEGVAQMVGERLLRRFRQRAADAGQQKAHEWFN
jgi:hypothetical protein